MAATRFFVIDFKKTPLYFVSLSLSFIIKSTPPGGQLKAPLKVYYRNDLKGNSRVFTPKSRVFPKKIAGKILKGKGNPKK